MDHHSVSALTLLGFHNDAPSNAMPVAWSGEWQARYDGWGGTYAAVTSQPGSCCTLRALDGRALLEVVATAWSGMIELSAVDERRVIDLYAPEHRLQLIDLPGHGKREVQLRLLDRTNPHAKDRQIWLRGINLEVRPSWIERHVRLNDALSLVDADEGKFLIMEKDNVISYWIKHGGSWGPQQVRQFRKFVEPGTTVIDIGANLGHHTVVLSKLVGSTGTVLAFEPQPRVHRLLQANLALNGCHNVIPFQQALGERAAEAWMFPPDYDTESWNVGSLQLSAHLESEASAPGVRVEVMRLDDLARDGRVDFIKSDAQGFDFSALRGGVGLLRADKPMILTEIAPNLTAEAGDDYHDFYAFLTDLGYRLADPDTLDFTAPPRQWSGRIDEEWDMLAVHASREDHFKRIAAVSSVNVR